jgi:hypothetical protein
VNNELSSNILCQCCKGILLMTLVDEYGSFALLMRCISSGGDGFGLEGFGSRTVRAISMGHQSIRLAKLYLRAVDLGANVIVSHIEEFASLLHATWSSFQR